MSTRGISLAESLIVLSLIALLLGAGLPAYRSLRSRARLDAASRSLALVLQALRWKSVSSHTSHGLWFSDDASGWGWVVVRDGNGNGLRTDELRRGVDPVISGRIRPVGTDRGVRLGIPVGREFTRVPPARGRLGALGGPVRFGRSMLIAFSPLGTSSSGTVYLTDTDGGLAAVVVFGAAARVRVWRHDERGNSWRG